MKSINNKGNKSSLIIMLTLLSVILSDVTVYALRCGLELVSVGDRKSEVIKKCGEPTYVEVWDEVRIKRDFYSPTLPDSEDEPYREPFLVKEYVTIEEWEYNFGPNRFVYYLRFERGKLKKITSGDYGY